MPMLIVMLSRPNMLYIHHSDIQVRVSAMRNFSAAEATRPSSVLLPEKSCTVG